MARSPIISFKFIRDEFNLNDEYEGGDFEICYPHPILDKTKVETFKLKKGEMIVFPSHTWHKVNKVTKGIRKALVGWVVGKPFI